MTLRFTVLKRIALGLVGLPVLAFTAMACFELIQHCEADAGVRRSISWVEVPTTAVQAQVILFDGVWHPHVKYSYVVDGKRYQGTRLAFAKPQYALSEERLMTMWNATHSESHAKKANAWFRTCWVDPSDPRSSVLVRSQHTTDWTVYARMIAGLAVCIGLLIWLARGIRSA